MYNKFVNKFNSSLRKEHIYKIGIPLTLNLCILIYLVLRANIFIPIKGHPFELTDSEAFYSIAAFITTNIFFVILNRERNFPISGKLVIGYFLILTIPIFFIKPLFSQDIYKNLILSKGFIHSRTNPYTTSPEMLNEYDTLNYIHNWQHVPMIHPPISVYYFSLPFLISTSDIFAITFLRVTSIALLLGIFQILRRIAKTHNKDEASLYKYVIALIPFVLINVVLDLHNDLLLVLPITLGYYFLLQKTYFKSFIALIIGFLSKYASVSLIPIVIFALIKERADLPTKKFLNVLLLAVSGILLTLIAFSPFMNAGKDLIGGTSYVTKLVSIYQTTPLTYLATQFFPPFFIRFAGLILATLLGIALYSKNKYLESFLWPILFIIMATTTWFMSWYILWALPFILIRMNDENWGTIVGIVYIFLLDLAGVGTFFPSIVVLMYILLKFVVRNKRRIKANQTA